MNTLGYTDFIKPEKRAADELPGHLDGAVVQILQHNYVRQLQFT